MIELKEPFATQWQGKDPFTEVAKLNGEVFRAWKHDVPYVLR